MARLPIICLHRLSTVDHALTHNALAYACRGIAILNCLPICNSLVVLWIIRLLLDLKLTLLHVSLAIDSSNSESMRYCLLLSLLVLLVENE